MQNTFSSFRYSYRMDIQLYFFCRFMWHIVTNQICWYSMQSCTGSQSYAKTNLNVIIFSHIQTRKFSLLLVFTCLCWQFVAHMLCLCWLCVHCLVSLSGRKAFDLSWYSQFPHKKKLQLFFNQTKYVLSCVIAEKATLNEWSCVCWWVGGGGSHLMNFMTGFCPLMACIILYLLIHCSMFK